MKCLVKFLQGEDLEMETTLEPKEILSMLSSVRFAVMFDDDEQTILANTDNINMVKIVKEPEKLEVGQGSGTPKVRGKSPEVMPGRKQD